MKVTIFFFLIFFILINCNIFAVINVSDTNSLIDAINTANAAPDTIQFTSNITLTKPLPAITNTFTIDGNDGTAWTLDGASTRRGFIILGGGPTIQDLIIQNATATGGAGGNTFGNEGGSGGGGLGAGGAIYVGNSANVSLSNITFTSNNATGGNAPAVAGIGASGGSGGGGLGGNGDNGAGDNGGGGGGIKMWSGSSGAGSTVGDASGNTGGGISPYKGANGATTAPLNATTPDYGGGGGGAANAAGAAASSAGAFGGGGGGGSSHATDNINASAGGFGGGGGGGGKNGSSASSTYGGGAGADGTAVGGQGGGGAGLGGAIFIDDTSTATIKDTTYDFSGSSVTAGTGANSGATAGTDIFLASGGTLKIDTNGTFTVANNIQADTLKTTGGVEILDSVGTGGTVDCTGRTNTFRGTFTLTKGTFKFNSNNAFGNVTGITFANNTDSKIFNSTGTFSISPPITMSGPGTMTAGAGITFGFSSPLTGTGQITVNGAGIVSAPGVASPGFSGGWNIDGGNLFFDVPGTVGTGTILINNGQLRHSSGANGHNLTNPITCSNISGILFRSGRTFTLSGVISGSGTLTFVNYLSGSTRSSGEPITLSNNNPFLGDVIIRACTINSSNANALSSASSIDLQRPSLLLIPTTQELKNIFTSQVPTVALPVDIQVNPTRTLSVTYTTDKVYRGGITSSGTFEKKGASTLTLNPAVVSPYTFTGNFIVTAGTLELNSTADLISNASSLTVNGGSLDITASTAAKTIKNLSGTGGQININNNNLSINQSSALQYSGVISGAGNVTKLGTSTLTLNGANVYSGTTSITAGTLALASSGTINNSSSVTVTSPGALQVNIGAGDKTVNNFSGTGNLILNNAGNTLTINQSNNLTYLGTVSGTGNFLKDGSAIFTVVNGGSMGATTVAQGTMLLKSSANWSASSFNINSGANLTGNGTVTANLTNNGTIAPGESIGTLNIVGNYTENGILDIEVTGSPSNQSDKVVVTGLPGTVTLNPASTLRVFPLTPSKFFEIGTEYVIITATGGVSGNFGSVIDLNPFLIFGVRYEANQVVLIMMDNIIRYITNKNAKAVGEYLESCDFENLDFKNVIISLSSLDLEHLTDALRQISPEVFGALQLTSYTNNQTISKILTDRLRKLYRCNKICKEITHKTCIKPNSNEFWIEPFSYFTHQRKLEKQRSYQNLVYGVATGVDYNFSNRVNFGGAFSYTFSDIDWKNNLGNAHIHSYYGSLYASNYNHFGFLNASFTATKNFYTTKRNISFADVKRSPQAKFKGFDINPHVGVGLDFVIKNNVTFQPTLDVDYIYVWRDSLIEKGANSLNLIVDTSNFSRVKGVFLLNLLKDHEFKNICISPSLKVGYSYENELSTGKIKSRLEGVSCTENRFSVQTFRDSHSKGIVGVSFLGTKKDGFTFYLNYQFEFGKKFYQHLASARVEWNF